MQNELFDRAQVERPRSCRMCRYYNRTPYDVCMKQGGAVLQSLEPCKHFDFPSPLQDNDTLLNDEMSIIKEEGHYNGL